MCRILDDKVYGVLNDLDLSSLRSDVESGNRTSFQRTGTPPYMAIELLKNAHSGAPPIRHLYRHDLESFGYIILTLCSGNQFNAVSRLIERLPKSPFDQWFNPNLSWDYLGSIKQDYLDGPLSLVTDVDPTFRGFIPWLRILLRSFKRGLSAKRNWRGEVDEYNAQLEESSLAGDADSVANDVLFDERVGAGDQAPQNFLEPPAAFDDENLNGHIDYLTLVRSLRTFNKVQLLYRDKDSLKANAT